MLDHFVFLAPLLLLPIVALLRFIGCSAFGATDTGGGVAVTLNPSSAALGPGQSQQFTALANGATSANFTWSPNAPNGLFKAPDPFAAGSTTATVTATSTTVAGTSGSATVTLKHVTVSIAPPSTALLPGASQQFTAAVQGSPDMNVTWKGANPSGLYTAPIPYVIGAPPAPVMATSNADASAQATANVTFIGNGARFVSPDTATQGTWQGIYGAAGWLLAGTPANLINLPPFLPSFTAPTEVFNYADPTVDPRGLQKPTASSTRFADVWFDDNVLNLELDFLDYQTHRVAVYFVDWDSLGRVQKIEIFDNSQAPPVILDSRNLSSFNGGQYLIWDFSGKVLLRITKTTGTNAVMSGIFFQ